MNVKGTVTSLVMVIVGIVVVFYLIGGTATTLTAASDNISASGLPLASLFSSNGVLMLILMAGVLLAIVAAAMSLHKKG